MKLSEWISTASEDFDVTPRYLEHLINQIYFRASEDTSVIFSDDMTYTYYGWGKPKDITLQTYRTNRIEISMAYIPGQDILVVLDDRDSARWDNILAQIIRESRLLNE